MPLNSGYVLTVSGMAFEAAIAAGDSIRTLYGLRPVKLITEIEQAIAQGASGIVSFGTAGGLLPTLASGTIVIARQVRWRQQAFAADAAWADALQKHVPGAVLADMAGADVPVTTADAKAALWLQTQAAAVDMESHLAARLAAEASLPFAAIRVVLDDAHRALPPAALLSTRPDGTVNYAWLLGSLLAHPGQLPAMLRLASDHAAAKKSLLRVSHLLKGSKFGLSLR